MLRVAPLFEKYTAAGNLILRQYAEHVVGVYRATENTAMPDKNNTGIDYLKWISFFEKNRMGVPFFEVFRKDGCSTMTENVWTL